MKVLVIWVSSETCVAFTFSLPALTMLHGVWELLMPVILWKRGYGRWDVAAVSTQGKGTHCTEKWGREGAYFSESECKVHCVQ